MNTENGIMDIRDIFHAMNVIVENAFHTKEDIKDCVLQGDKITDLEGIYLYAHNDQTRTAYDKLKTTNIPLSKSDLSIAV